MAPVQVEKDYPAVFRHLSSFLPEIAVRFDKGKHWTNLRNCAFLLDFEKPKIVWGELSDTAKFAYDDEAHYVEASTFIMVGKHLKYLLAILNSHAASWYFDQITTTSGVGTTRWKKYKIEQLPAPQPTSQIDNRIEKLVDVVGEKKRSGNTSSEEEAEINALIFHCYGFSSAEILLLLTARKTSDNEQGLIMKYFQTLKRVDALS